MRAQDERRPLLTIHVRHGLRQAGYGPYDYFGEFGQVVQALQGDANIKVGNNLIAPSVATGDWTPEGSASTGFFAQSDSH